MKESDMPMKIARVRGKLGLILAGCALLLLGACAAPVRVEWQTETELNTAGFNLYRSTSPEGPFDVKVNDELIPPAEDPLTGRDYTYIDRTAQSGVTYYYQLQEVERNGGVNTFGPISVRTGGLDGRHAAVLGALAVVVLLLWLRGGRRAARRAASARHTAAEARHTAAGARHTTAGRENTE